MRRLTHGRMDRNGLLRTTSRSSTLLSSGVLPSLRARRVLALLFSPIPLGVVAAACGTDPVGIPIEPTMPGDVAIDPGDTDLIERCGEDGIKCGEGCCSRGNTCSDFDRCIPAVPCTSSDECSADSQCAAGVCSPWNVLPRGAQFSRSCRNTVDLPSVVPEVQCQWPGPTAPAVLPNQVQVIGTPMVVDFNSDGDATTSQPSIVFISYEGPFSTNTGSIRVIDGKTCELQDTIQGELPFTPEVPLALGDVNNDGRPDIVAADEEQVGAAIRSGIAIFELAGSGPVPKFQLMQRGRIQSTGTGNITGFALHDVDNDDYPEIFTEKTMLRYDEDFGGLVDISAIIPSGHQALTTVEPPTVVDIDGDRQAEVVTPQGVFTWDTLTNKFIDKSRGGSAPLWNPDELIDLNGAFMGLANLRPDWATGLPQGKDSAELVVIGHDGSLYVRQVDGQTRFRMELPGFAGGPPVIADIDGDGRMEFASGGQDKLTVFDLDCTTLFFNQQGCERGSGEERSNGIVWEAKTQGARSGLAVFDFDGDGRTELVYADQCFMRVYDGLTGDVLFSTPRMSTTQFEYPVVADTDGDGFSEIVTTSNDNDTSVSCPEFDEENENARVRFEPTHGVTVWKEAEDRWAGSRPIWNQHNYFVTNVRDDGTIPPMGQVETHWLAGGPNSFRQNVQGTTGKSLSLVDVTTAGVPTFECKPGERVATVTVDLCNRGATMLRENQTEIALIDIAQPTNVLCRQSNDRDIDSGECIEVSCDVPVSPRAAPFDLMIMGDPLLQVDECIEDNNRSMISGIVCQSNDPT
jgi:hypothetical protein